MQQSRLESLLETVTSVGIGFVISCAAWPFVAMVAGIEYNHIQNLGITTFFTVLSIIRGYVIRRWFAKGIHQAIHNFARKYHDKV